VKAAARPEFGVSELIYGRLLLAYPRAHRAAYGAAMTQLFRDQCRDAWKEARHWGLLLLWLRVLPDLASTSIMERLAALNERKNMIQKLASLSPVGASPKIVFATVFAGVFVLIFFTSVVVTFLVPESYASTARLRVENSRGNPATYDPYFIQTTLEIIQSQAVLQPVVEELKLNEVWGKKYSNGELLKTSKTMGLLRQSLQASPVKNTMFIAITDYSDDRNEAAQIANAVAKSYQNYVAQTRDELAAKSLAALQQQYQEQDKQIQQAQTEAAAPGQPAKDGSADASSAAIAQSKTRNLDNLLDAHKTLFAKIEAEKLAAQLPQTLVQITDPAEPGQRPVRPNMTVNIGLGAIMGGFLGVMAGGIAAFVAFKFGGRRGNRTSPA